MHSVTSFGSIWFYFPLSSWLCPRRKRETNTCGFPAPLIFSIMLYRLYFFEILNYFLLGAVTFVWSGHVGGERGMLLDSGFCSSARAETHRAMLEKKKKIRVLGLTLSAVELCDYNKIGNGSTQAIRTARFLRGSTDPPPHSIPKEIGCV